FKSTPERRAFDSPMAMACFVDRAPCFPSRTWCISSRTNSPAWVLGAFPSRRSSSARSRVSFSGICPPSSNRNLRNAQQFPRTRVQGVDQHRAPAVLSTAGRSLEPRGGRALEEVQEGDLVGERDLDDLQAEALGQV